ncbi:YqkE family protein [Neobacillus sp. OS1-32]|uniref:YqkE family protein n=1 Tax=Neobacillus paridis TaxID=2803862 RepID=A0ABS1TU28_9BACI|nr:MULTISPECIES: YqkE family protein [Neobacillus]MBL4954058.1 YqkE family protein [Neobacillus paridis]WML30793.1 YqkE family protein [Neobacillus sp. OS1-32]
MKKKQHKPTPKKDDSALTLKDMINPDLLKQLKNQQEQLKAEEEKRQELEEHRKREERRLKEKNKSFEELLNESSMNWKEFK